MSVTPVPLPTASIPTPPPSVVELQNSTAFDLDWIAQTLADIRGFLEGAGKAVDGFAAVYGGEYTLWDVLWYLNGPFDVAMHWLLGAFLGLSVWLLTWGILSTVELHWGERLPGGSSATAQRDLGIKFFSGLFAACASVGVHLWWDGLRLVPGSLGSWIFWLGIGGSISLAAFMVGWFFAGVNEAGSGG